MGSKQSSNRQPSPDERSQQEPRVVSIIEKPQVVLSNLKPSSSVKKPIEASTSYYESYPALRPTAEISRTKDEKPETAYRQAVRQADNLERKVTDLRKLPSKEVQKTMTQRQVNINAISSYDQRRTDTATIITGETHKIASDRAKTALQQSPRKENWGITNQVGYRKPKIEDLERRPSSKLKNKKKFQHFKGETRFSTSDFPDNQKQKGRKSKAPVCNEHGEPIYQGDGRCYGYFECDCGRTWESGNCWAGYGQQCQSCRIEVFPYCQHYLVVSTNHCDPDKPHPTHLCGKCKTLGSPCYKLYGFSDQRRRSVYDNDYSEDEDDSQGDDSYRYRYGYSHDIYSFDNDD